MQIAHIMQIAGSLSYAPMNRNLEKSVRLQIRSHFPNRVTIKHPFSLNKDVQREMKKHTTTTVTFPPERARAANAETVSS